MLGFVLVGCGEQRKTASSLQSASNFTKRSFMPENDLWRQANLVGDNGMTEEEFNSIIDSVRTVYEPIVQGLGGNLVIQSDWQDTTVNAYAEREDGNWNVHMFGGLAKRPEVTPDGFRMVIAHEIGHHLGGFPFVSDWAANEGEADLFATLAAARNLWKNDTKTIKEVDATAKKLCDDNVGKENQLLCYRSMTAGHSLAKLLGALGNTKVSFKTPDKSVVKKTDDQHPVAQCRLDTYVAGTLCQTAWNDGVIPQTETDAKRQSCFNTSKNGYSIQARPRCWFHPSN